MRVLAVIPARYFSSRLPGKPLALLCGRSLIERAWRIAADAFGSEHVFVATDHCAIYDHVRGFGGAAVLTSEECRNGTERVWAALWELGIGADIVINFQGDAVLTPPWVLAAVADLMRNRTEVQMATAAVKLSPVECRMWMERKVAGDTTGTFVVCAHDGRALYFSKAFIPFVRGGDFSAHAVMRHIGIYGYRLEALERYLCFEPGPLEDAEGLEQLRALENGMPVHVALVDYRGRTHCAVDKLEDLKTAEEIIAREGELVKW